MTVHYTRDGSIPTTASPTFVGSELFELPPTGNQVIATLVVGGAWERAYQAFGYARS